MTDLLSAPADPVTTAQTAAPSRRAALDELVEERGSGELARLRSRFAAAFEILRRDAVGADRTGSVQHEGVRALVDSGFTRLRVPESAGGIDVPLMDAFALLTDLGAADPGVANALRGHFSFIEILRHQPGIDPHVREHWLSEIVAGRIFGNAQTAPPGAEPTTVRQSDAGDWLITGSKYYSSGSLYADYIRASGEDESGRPVWAIVPTAQERVRREPDWRGFGQRTSASGSTVFSDAVVHPLGLVPIDRGVAQHQSYVQLYHLATLTGIVREVLDEAITVNVIRPPRRQSFGDHALDVVGSLYASYVTAQALLRTSADVLHSANTRFLADGDRASYERLSVYTIASQVTVIETALEATSRLFDAAGASLAETARGLDRHWRNARTIASRNPVAVKPRLIGEHLVNGRFYVSPFAPFDAEGRLADSAAIGAGE
ncbi:acyl-CoA dehydrogenase family protein [Microbacterium sp.]|uniref:acyl-CoA dehydrogenase family protein n=1 Tax=Microbacterium sp. TaxID=51671 RepID=UPI0039E27889